MIHSETTSTDSATRPRRRSPTLVFMIALLVPTLVGVPLAPKLVHGVDFGAEALTIDDFAAGNHLRSSNVTVRNARAALDHTIDVSTVEERGSTERRTWTRSYVPLVPRGWKKTDEIHFVLKTDEIDDKLAEELERAGDFRGIARNVMWEDLPLDQRIYLVQLEGLKLSTDVVMLEYQANPRWDLAVFVGATGGLLVLSMLGAVMIVRQSRIRHSSSPVA